jgi:anti-sigma B factor antagonist
MALQITVNDRGEIKVLVLKGRLRLGEESVEFRGKIKEALGDAHWLDQKWGWKTQLVLDLGEVDYVDSAGLGALIAARTSALHQGADLKLAHLTKSLRDQMAITKLVTIFDVFDSVDATVKSFPKPVGVASDT